MFLRKIVLHNVRCIEELALEFLEVDADGHPLPAGRGAKQAGRSRKWTLLLGQNGAGKSSVLRSIALLLAGSEALPDLLGDPERWIRRGCDEGSICGEFVTAKGAAHSIRLNIRRGRNVRQVFDDNRETMEEIDDALAHTSRSYFTVGYGASRRLSSAAWSAEGGPIKNPRAQSVGTLFSPDALLNPLEAWAINLDYEHGAKGLVTVRKALDALLPGVTFSHIDKSRRELIFDTADGPLPFAQLSDGYQNMAAWCGDLLYRIATVFGDYAKPLEARGLLLVDEIDLHLHPIWQRNLRDFLSSSLPNIQIVATTHSPLTAHQAGAGELYFLARQASGRVELAPFHGAPNLLLAHQLIASPAFGLETLDSSHVEALKNEYRELKQKAGGTPVAKAPASRSRGARAAKGGLDAKGQQKLDELTVQLQALPGWSASSPREGHEAALVRQLSEALRKDRQP